ncbi:MAG: virulence RhuM family protein, partial [Bacteroidales bacterium]|nr:virulence RhuM family protein [Bacteroidales bacterium]
EFAEGRAKRRIPMTMEDWSKRIDAYLASDERQLLSNAGSVSHEDAVLHAETEFEKYRIVQDRLFRSDFDDFLLKLPFEE